MADNPICSAEDCGKPSKWRGLCQAHYMRLLRHGDPLGGRTHRGELARFIEETVLTHKSADCLLWPYSKNKFGYGQIKANGKMMRVNRYVCELIHGKAPTPKHAAAHECGNRACVNPNHLAWKTNAENSADKITHGTIACGESHGMAKLTVTEVREIRRLMGTKTRREIANQFGIHQDQVGNIHRRKQWAWLDP